LIPDDFGLISPTDESLFLFLAQTQANKCNISVYCLASGALDRLALLLLIPEITVSNMDPGTSCRDRCLRGFPH